MNVLYLRCVLTSTSNHSTNTPFARILLPMALLAMVSPAADPPTIASQYGSVSKQIIDAALQDDAGYARLATRCAIGLGIV